MNQYDLLIVNGCSFSEGGGLNNPKIYEFLTNKPYKKEDAEYFMFNESYVKKLSFLIGCDCVNISKSASSNNLILQSSYDEIKKYKNKKILLINQLTYPTRLGFEVDKKYYSYNGTAGKVFYDVTPNGFENKSSSEIKNDKFDEYYKKYFLDIYDEEFYSKTLFSQMDMFNSWCKNNNVDNYWIYWHEFGDIKNKDNVICMDGNLSIDEWSNLYNLKLQDVDKIPVLDMHLSIDGHNRIAKIIYDKIIKK
jgi:hypothetical protein